MAAKPNYAGLRRWSKARNTGTIVAIYDGIAADMDVTVGRWQTVCEDHGTIISHKTLALANSHASVPQDWCEGCQA